MVGWVDEGKKNRLFTENLYIMEGMYVFVEWENHHFAYTLYVQLNYQSRFLLLCKMKSRIFEGSMYEMELNLFNSFFLLSIV